MSRYGSFKIPLINNLWPQPSCNENKNKSSTMSITSTFCTQSGYFLMKLSRHLFVSFSWEHFWSRTFTTTMRFKTVLEKMIRIYTFNLLLFINTPWPLSVLLLSDISLLRLSLFSFFFCVIFSSYSLLSIFFFPFLFSLLIDIEKLFWISVYKLFCYTSRSV